MQEDGCRSGRHFPTPAVQGRGQFPTHPHPRMASPWADGVTMAFPFPQRLRKIQNEANGSGGSTWRWEGKAGSTADLLRTLSNPSNSSFAWSTLSVPGIIVSPSAGGGVQSSGSPVRWVPVRPPFPGEDIGDQKGKLGHHHEEESGAELGVHACLRDLQPHC